MLKKIFFSIISKRAKVICATIATISFVVSAFLLLPPGWFWISWQAIGGALVAIGCLGEWHQFRHPAETGHELKHRRRELEFITVVAVGVTMGLVGLSHSIPEAWRLERDVTTLMRENLLLRSNAAALEMAAVRQLGNLHAQPANARKETSPGARVEARSNTPVAVPSNARAAAPSNSGVAANVRPMTPLPIKERLVECLNDIDPGIIPAVKAGRTTFELTLPMYQYRRLESIAVERGSGAYMYPAVIDSTSTVIAGVGAAQHLRIALKPELVN